MQRHLCYSEEWFRLQRSWRQRGPRPILILLQQRKMVSPAVVVAATSSASDSNIVAAKEIVAANLAAGPFFVPAIQLRRVLKQVFSEVYPKWFLAGKRFH